MDTSDLDEQMDDGNEGVRPEQPDGAEHAEELMEGVYNL